VVTALVNIYKVNGNWDLSILPELTDLVGSFSNLLLKANQPIVGENAFTHKAGLHVKAVAKDPRSYEAISPETLNRKRKLIIDKYTGSSALKNKFNEIGITNLMLDLKLKDIPETVYKAIKALDNIQFGFLTIHGQGGKSMIDKAKKAADEIKSRPKIMMVTILTTLNDEDLKTIGSNSTVNEQVEKLATLQRKLAWA